MLENFQSDASLMRIKDDGLLILKINFPSFNKLVELLLKYLDSKDELEMFPLTTLKISNRSI